MGSQRSALYINRSKSLNSFKSTLASVLEDLRANLPNPAVEELELNLAVFPPPSPTEIIGSFVSGILAAAFTYILPGSSLSYYHTKLSSGRSALAGVRDVEWYKRKLAKEYKAQARAVKTEREVRGAGVLG